MRDVLVVGRLVADNRWRPLGNRTLLGCDFRWATTFVAPYVAVFFAFVVYPDACAIWMASKPSLYADLMADQSYASTVINTLVFVGFGANVKMFLALLLSGFFMRRSWWIKALLAVYVLPWKIATAQACVSFHLDKSFGNDVSFGRDAGGNAAERGMPPTEAAAVAKSCASGPARPVPAMIPKPLR